MSATPLLIPPQAGALLGRLPAYPGSLLFVGALNLALAKRLASDVAAMLSGKKIRLRVTDAQWTFDFEWRTDRFVACQKSAEADLCISASAHDFVRLARRQEDPDTLFFNRRLTMEGDTELGLLVKNTMDALELPVLDLDYFRPSLLLKRWKSRRAGR